MRAELAARARARGAARHANGSGGLKAQLKQAKAAARHMAGLLLQARTAGQHVASALTDAKTRGVLCYCQRHRGGDASRAVGAHPRHC